MGSSEWTSFWSTQWSTRGPLGPFLVHPDDPHPPAPLLPRRGRNYSFKYDQAGSNTPNPQSPKGGLEALGQDNHQQVTTSPRGGYVTGHHTQQLQHQRYDQPAGLCLQNSLEAPLKG